MLSNRYATCACETEEVSGCTDPCALNYEPDANVDDGSCIYPEEPSMECYQTSTFNDITCEWEVTGTQPVEPTVECYQLTTFNDVTCEWEITGEQPEQPATECYQTATFNDVSCEWEVTGTPPIEPTVECYQMTTFNDATCEWEISGTQPEQPTTECYQTATFNDVSCEWEVIGTPPEIDDGCDLTEDSFDAITCEVINTPTCPPDTFFNASTCECETEEVPGCTDPCALNYDPDANVDDGSCIYPEAPLVECYQTTTFNDATCEWEVSGEQPEQPVIECYQTATFNDATTRTADYSML